MEFGCYPPNKIVLFRKWLKMCLILKKLSLNINLMYLSQWINNKLISEIFKSIPKKSRLWH